MPQSWGQRVATPEKASGFCWPIRPLCLITLALLSGLSESTESPIPQASCSKMGQSKDSSFIFAGSDLLFDGMAAQRLWYQEGTCGCQLFLTTG